MYTSPQSAQPELTGDRFWLPASFQAALRVRACRRLILGVSKSLQKRKTRSRKFCAPEAKPDENRFDSFVIGAQNPVGEFCAPMAKPDENRCDSFVIEAQNPVGVLRSYDQTQ
jgi:hypothetical protein